MTNDLISIIIPIYNVEKYLEKCINSVLEQTYGNIEVILVDDGSPDNCGKICDEYKKKDSRIIVIHKKNGGLSDARNKGIDIANGKYIYFLDSDDYIERDTIQYLYSIICKYNAQIAIAGIRDTFEHQSKNKKNSTGSKEEVVKILNSKEALETMLYNTEFSNMACNKLYEKKLFSKIRYPKGKLYEDLGTTYKVLDLASEIVLSSKMTYNYLADRKSSIMNQKYSKNRMQSLIFMEEIVDFVRKKYPDIEVAAISRMYMECIFILLKLPFTNNKDDNKKVKNFIKKYRWVVIKNKKLPIKQKLLCIITIGGRIPLRIVWILKEFIKRIK